MHTYVTNWGRDVYFVSREEMLRSLDKDIREEVLRNDMSCLSILPLCGYRVKYSKNNKLLSIHRYNDKAQPLSLYKLKICINKKPARI